MTSREEVRPVFQRRGTGQGVIWTGHPNDLTIPIYARAWGIEPTREAIFTHLQDDCRWLWADPAYHHPEGRPLFDPAYGLEGGRATLSAMGCFGQAQSVAEIEAYPWPELGYCDFSGVIEEIERHADKMVFTGFWCPFFHLITDFFGMENCFVQMYENPVLVQCAIEHMVDFFVEANDRFFTQLGDRADVMFFGNDIGSQLDMLISPELFRKFLLPSFKRLIAVGKKHGKFIMLHSCGSIRRIIPDLIDAGVDALHPLQAQAAGMSARELSQFKDHLAFVGGIDAQSFFVNSTPEQIETEVRRVYDLLGPNIIISPSHEEILPNVPAQNMEAMARAAHALGISKGGTPS